MLLCPSLNGRLRRLLSRVLSSLVKQHMAWLIKTPSWFASATRDQVSPGDRGGLSLGGLFSASACAAWTGGRRWGSRCGMRHLTPWRSDWAGSGHRAGSVPGSADLNCGREAGLTPPASCRRLRGVREAQQGLSTQGERVAKKKFWIRGCSVSSGAASPS